ncbi:MAG: hypothetical protein J2P15_23425 [Micromonosporaceae bacterium]|nr:hypothetical protein [Micromonosporaceae bacterium]
MEESIEGRAVRYEIRRRQYGVDVFVDPARFIGLRLDLRAEDGSAALHYAVDTDLYDISQARYAKFAADVETDIVIFLDGLASGEILTRMTQPNPATIVPTGEGPRLLKRTRLGTTAGPYRYNKDAAVRDGFTPLAV